MSRCALREDAAHASQERYIYQRVVDALLREDVRECTSRAAVIDGQMLAFKAVISSALSNGKWLYIEHLDHLYIPVAASDYMQSWRLRGDALIEFKDTRVRRLATIEAVLECFQRGLGEPLRREFTAFAKECQTAIRHGEACRIARQRYFEQAATHQEGTRFNWHRRMLDYERLASFLDHPYYPTARAKLGFSTADLALYTAEFTAQFELQWLAVPKGLYRSTPVALPDWWPSFADVGLDQALAADFALLPVHPFMWRHYLPARLDEASLASAVVPAPNAYLEVAATLSVRTVMVCRAPRWHLKLPLWIRTLGARNIRTIKPSTIRDGHLMQGILATIAARSPEFAGRLLLTDETRGAVVADEASLGFILRRYPSDVERTSVVPVAAFMADTPGGACVFEELAQQFSDGNVRQLFAAYVQLTLRLHLILWIRYGVALESNQQNTLVVFTHQSSPMRLLLRDNDAGRIDAQQLVRRCPELRQEVESLLDRRILVDEPLALAKMFVTITLQLNIAALVEGLAARAGQDRVALYQLVRRETASLLDELASQGESVDLARRVLLEDDQTYLKYLLRAATLENKESTGATDVNKFYGKTAPNLLRIGMEPM